MTLDANAVDHQAILRSLVGDYVREAVAANGRMSARDAPVGYAKHHLAAATLHTALVAAADDRFPRARQAMSARSR